MKRLIRAVAGIVTIILGVFVIGGLETAPLTAETAKTRNLGSELYASYVDGIKIPSEVLMKIQMDYQGYAVTHASKTVKNNKPAYQLRVDRDTAGTGAKNFYLFYDMKWKRIAKEDAPAPQQIPIEVQIPKQDDSDDKEEPRQELEPDDNSGHGSDEEKPEPKPKPKPEPEPEPSPEPEPEPEEPGTSGPSQN